MKKIVIIPAYNESGNINNLLNKLSQFNDYHVVVVNDCSTDNTVEICRKWENIKVLDLPFNLGIGGAVQTGYRYAWQNNYDIAIQVDGDGQHDPSFLDSLVAPLEVMGCEMVIGSRFLENEGFQSTSLRRAGIGFFSWLIKILTGQLITDPTSGFRACNKRVISYFANHYPKDYPEPETIISVYRLGGKIKEIPVIMHERRSGVSSINYLKSIYYMLKVTLAILIDLLKKEKDKLP